MVGPSTQEKKDEVSPVTSSFHGALRPQEPCGLLVTGEEWDRGMRAQAHLPVHTAPEPCPATLRFSVALRPQKPSGLSGTESPGRPHRHFHTAPELCPFCLFVCLFVSMLLFIHRNRKLIRDGEESGIGNESPGPPPCSHGS